MGDVYSFPNPAIGGKRPTIHVECGIAESVEIRIYEITGALIHEVKLTDQPHVINSRYAYEYRWDISNASSGGYIVVVVAKKSGENDIKIIKKLALIK